MPPTPISNHFKPGFDERVSFTTGGMQTSSVFLIRARASKWGAKMRKTSGHRIQTALAGLRVPQYSQFEGGSGSYSGISPKSDPAALYRELLLAASLSRNRHVLHSLMFPCKIFRNDHAVEHFTS